MRNFVSFMLVTALVWQSSAFSSDPGPEECVKNVTITNISNNSMVYVPNNILCFICTTSINRYSFSINETEILNDDFPARVVLGESALNDILVVFGAEIAFNSFLTRVKCIQNPSNGHIPPEYHVRVSLYDLNPPLVGKDSTTITEGSTVNLGCDGSNSIPQPSLKWISPNGTVISETGQLEIVDITESETGLYTCIATLPLSHSTTNSTVVVQLINSTSVTTESIMTSSLPMDGDDSGEWYENRLYWVAGGAGILTCCCCITNCITITCLCHYKRKKKSKKRRHSLLRENSAFSEPVGAAAVATQQPPLTVQNSHYLTLEPSTSENTTPFTGQYYMIETQTEPPESPVIPAVPMTQYSMIQTLPPESAPSEPASQRQEPFTASTGQYSTIESVMRPATNGPGQKTPDEEIQYSEPQIKSGVGYSTIQEKPSVDAQYSVVQKRSAETAEPSRVKNTKGLLYIEVGLEKAAALRPPSPIAERVEYASLNLKTMAERPPPPKEPQTHHLDASISLDQILIQLKEVEPNWRRFGEAVGTERLDDIWDYVETESGAMVEVVDGWLAKLHPRKPTWREISNLVESIGHHHLAISLRQVYITGVLPIEVSNNVPDSLVASTAPPPPDIPSREPYKIEDTTSSADEMPPPIPLRTYSKSS